MQSRSKVVKSYFKNLVASTDVIKHYIGTSKKELMNFLSKSKSVDDPFLVLFSYDGKLDGNNQRTFGTRSVSFAILFRTSNANNIEDQDEKIDLAEEYLLQVLSRINYDSKSGDVEWLKDAFKKDSVKFSEVTYETANGLFGFECHFDVDVKNPLIADNSFWNDKDFCTK